MEHIAFIDHVVKGIVSEPDSVRVELAQEREGAVFYVSVAPNDVGKMIGKNGRVITALRHVVSAIAAKGRMKAHVKVITD